MILEAMVEDKLQALGKGYDRNVEVHHARLRRTLTLVKHCHGTFTTTIARRLTGWEERSIQRYVTELHGVGLIERPNDRHLPYRWAITQSGRDELLNTSVGVP